MYHSTIVVLGNEQVMRIRQQLLVVSQKKCIVALDNQAKLLSETAMVSHDEATVSGQSTRATPCAR